MSFGSSSYNNPPPWSRSSNTSHSGHMTSYQNVGGPTYPIKRPHSPNNYGSWYQQTSSTHKIKTSSGYVTKLYDSWGIIDNEIQFSFSACTKGIPKLKDYVNIETIHSPGTTYKWRAIKVILNNGRDYSNLKPIPNSRTENDYRRSRLLDKSREISRERKYDDVERKRFKRDDKEENLNKSRSDADIITLKKRYPALYIPSDFFTSRIRWCETFPVTKPFTLNRPCSFHVMHKECDSYKRNDAIIDPPDLDYTFSAKVMLMSVPRLEEIYRKSICTAENLGKDDEKNYTHISRLVQFLVGSRGKNEPLAIGRSMESIFGWRKSDKDPSVLIKTAIRTCKALTGIDLSVCFQWDQPAEKFVLLLRKLSYSLTPTHPLKILTPLF